MSSTISDTTEGAGVAVGVGSGGVALQQNTLGRCPQRVKVDGEDENVNRVENYWIGMPVLSGALNQKVRSEICKYVRSKTKNLPCCSWSMRSKRRREDDVQLASWVIIIKIIINKILLLLLSSKVILTIIIMIKIKIVY